MGSSRGEAEWTTNSVCRLSFILLTALLLVSCGGPSPFKLADGSAPDSAKTIDHDLVVFFEIDAPQESIDAVEQILLAKAEVDRFWFLSPEAAQKEYEAMFGEQAEVDLPASFRILVRSPEDIDRLEPELRLAAGVYTVGRSAGRSEVQEMLTVAMTPEATDAEIDAMWDYLLIAPGVDDFTLVSTAGQDFFSRFGSADIFDGEMGVAFLVELDPDPNPEALMETISAMDGVLGIVGGPQSTED